MKSTILQSLLFLLAISGLISDCTSHKQKESATNPIDSKWLEEITVSQLQAGYMDGSYTVKDVVAAYLGRINEIDKLGPALNSIIMVNRMPSV
jgi:amidase